MTLFTRGICFFSLMATVFGDESRSYVDSKGVEHTTSKDKPKIAIFAHRAVSMRSYGLDHEQLVAVYGEWYNSGSDVDVGSPQDGSSLPADPLWDDIQFLEKVVDLSPGCHVGYCTEFDLETFKALEDIDELLIHGYRGAWWGQNATYSEFLIAEATAKLGKPPIYLELSKEGADGCPDHPTNSSSLCPGLSMIDLIEENFELARYLNLEIPLSLNADRQLLCNSAKTFQDHMKTAHDKGVRLMAAYPTTTTSYFADPVSDGVLRMFEELGMPLLHIGKCMDAGVCGGDYFWEYIPLNTYFQSCPSGPENVAASCNNDPYYPVDMWLYDHRVTLRVSDPDFVVGFPDEAFIQDQKAYWPIGGRLITPKDAAEILDIIGPKVAAASRIHPKTECTPDVNVTGAEHRIAGISGGNYACFSDKFHNTKYYEQCDFSHFDPPKKGLSGGAIAGIVVGSLVGLALIVVVGMRFQNKKEVEG